MVRSLAAVRAGGSGRRRPSLAAASVLAVVAGLLSLVGVMGAPPAQALGDSGMSVISAGETYSCGITNAGAAMCWGNNASGQLGNNSGIGSLVPVQVSGLTSGVTAISAGSTHSCAVVSGAAKCWGAGANGRLGNNSTADSLVPVQVSGLTSGVTAISVGSGQSCAVVSGAAKCWGVGGNGRLGNNSTADSTVPVQVSGLTTGVTGISAGSNHSCAVVSGGARCWGLNGTGQLGDGFTTQSTVPVQVSGLSSGVTAISAGGAHSCAVWSAGAWCWGSGGNGQLGNSSLAQSNYPVQVTGLTTGVTAISAAAQHSCAVVSGAAKCWGNNGSGRLGNNSTTGTSSPVQVSGMTTGVTAINAGNFHTCAVGSNAAKCWGLNTNGRLGDNSTTQSSVPVTVSGGSSWGPPSNAAPVAAGASHDVQRGPANQIVFNLSATDAENDTIDGSVAGTGFTKLTNPTVGTLSCTPAGACTYSVPSNATPGSYTFTWNVKDATSTSATATETLVVKNTAPTVLPVTVNDVQRGRPASDKAFTLSGSDTNANTLTYSVVSAPSTGTLSCSSGGACTYAVPADTATGNVTFTYKASDGLADSGTATVTLGVANTTPVANNVGPLHTTVGSTLPVTLNGTDFNGDTLAYAAPVAAPGKGSVTGGSSASRTYTPSANTKGNDSFTYTVSDNAPSTSTTGTVSVIIDNSAPTATSRSLNASRGVAKSFSLQGTDANGDALTFAVQVNVTKGVLSCDTDGACTYTAGPGQSGVDSFDFVANDGTANSAVGTVTFDISNEAPIASGQSVTAPRGVGSHIVLSATDPNSDVLTYDVADDPAKGTLDCNGAHGEDCIYTAGPGQTGSDSFTFTATDGAEVSNTATVSITISNQPPNADAIVSSAPRGVATEIVLTGSDPNGDPITFAKASNPSKGSASCTSAGICTYTATPGSSGDDTFTFTTSDGLLESSPATVTVHLTNQAPTADARSLDAGRGVATPVVLSGVDPNGDGLSFSVVDQPAMGSVSCTGANCTYTSQVVATGTDSFTYRADDGDLSSAPVTVSITLVNAGPTANDQAVSAPRGVATPIVLSGADPEGDGITFAIAAQPTKGLVSCTGASCSYTAGAGQSGADTFTFTTTDGTATSPPATVTITISNQAPVANAQTVAANAPLTGTPITLTGSDPNSDALTYAKASNPSKGLVSCINGSCTYTAAAGKTGTDSFTFTATDPNGLASTATVTVNLDAVTPGVYVGQVDYIEPESGNATYRGPFIPVTLTTPAASPVTVWYYTVNGTAVTTGLGGDYRQWGTPSSPMSITIPAGSTTGWIQPPVFDDNLVEGTESFGVVISSLTGGASYLGAGSTQVNILDSDTISTGKPILWLAAGAQGEGNSGRFVAGFRLLLSKASSAPVKATCTTAAGTAQAGRDFKATTFNATIAAGALSTSLDVLLYPNTTANADRSFDLACTLVGNPDVTFLDTSHTFTINDED